MLPASKEKTYGDAFGRVIRVDEPGGSPASGTVTITGSEQVCPSGCGVGGPLYDDGFVTLGVNGVSSQTEYMQGSTSQTVAAAPVAGFNASAAGVTVSRAGSTITLTSIESGADVSIAFSVTSRTTLSRFFAHPSFSGSPSSGSLTGGSDTVANPSLAAPFITYYSYDAMGHLVQAKQGLQVRSATFNGVGRLISQQTPEAGQVTFSYAASCSTDLSNACNRTDARGVITTYTYDGLNRLKTVGYSDSTPGVTFNYDAGGAAAFALGRLTSMVDGTGSETYSYNQLGRITNVAEVVGATNYNVGYSYNYVGETKTLTYPSGRVVTQAYDAVGRMNQISSGGTNYLTVPANGLTPAGLPTAINYGNGVVATVGYNARLQLSSLDYAKGATDLLNLTYNYDQNVAGNIVNNGQIQGIADTRGNAYSTSYTYDALGRMVQGQTLDLAAANTWKLQWTYDRYGNRPTQTLTGGTISVTQPQLTVNHATNRISTSGYAYDLAGNMTNDILHAYAFDGESRIKTVDVGQTNNSTYSYDGKSMRVKKVVVSGGTTTTTVYIVSGSKVIAEYVGGTLSKEYVYSGSQLLVTIAGSAVTYRHPDHLTGRLETDATGAVTRTFGQLPFGEVWYETGTASKWKFNTYERDSDSGLDYATFRYDSSRLGRFMTPDLLAGTITDPQSLNRYSYVGNDPLDLTDPLGLLQSVCGKTGPCGDDVFEDGGSGGGGGGAGPGGGQGPGGGGGIAKQLEKLRKLIDPKCLEFLNSNNLNALDTIKQIVDNGLFGTTTIDPVQQTTTTGPKDISSGLGTVFGTTTTTTTTFINNGDAGLVPGQAITINTEGAYFYDKFKDVKLTTDRGKIKGGIEAAQLFILLHEVAHSTQVLEHDAGDQNLVNKNDKKLEEKCGDTIKKFGKD